MNCITLDRVSVVFRHKKERLLLRDRLQDAVKNERLPGFYALHNVSFEIKPAESVVVVGANGAGKSTLLSLISGVLEPDQGKVEVNGRLGALLELGSGFHPDLTGLENLTLNAALVGLTRPETRERARQIIDFSELGEFIHDPLRTYSAGMIMRLGFSVAIHTDPDVLLIDEILSVGDAAFQRRCIDRIMRLRNEGTTLVCVSHQPQSVSELCGRMIWLHLGQVIRDGKFAEVAPDYNEFMTDPNRRFGDELPTAPVPVNTSASIVPDSPKKSRTGR